MSEERREKIESLVSDCIIAHQESIIVSLIQQLEEEYKELALLATLGEYKDSWTKQQVLDFVTYET